MCKQKQNTRGYYKGPGGEKNPNDFGWTPTTTKKNKKLEKVFFCFFVAWWWCERVQRPEASIDSLTSFSRYSLSLGCVHSVLSSIEDSEKTKNKRRIGRRFNDLLTRNNHMKNKKRKSSTTIDENMEDISNLFVIFYVLKIWYDDDRLSFFFCPVCDRLSFARYVSMAVFPPLWYKQHPVCIDYRLSLTHNFPCLCRSFILYVLFC